MWSQRCPPQGTKINWGDQTLAIQRLAIAGGSYGSKTELIVPATNRFVLVMGSVFTFGGTNIKFSSAPIGSYVSPRNLTGSLLNLSNGPLEPFWSPSGLFRTRDGESLWVAGSVYPITLEGEFFYVTPRF